MGNLYDNIIALCESRGIKGGKMCTDIGISKGLITDLKMGRRTGVSAVTAQKIAAYFGVSVGYLLGEEEKETKKEQPIENDGLSPKRKAFIDKVMQMSDEELDRLDKILALVERTAQ
jgi:transcriptional regulator with XRE-family HTH domain